MMSRSFVSAVSAGEKTESQVYNAHVSTNSSGMDFRSVLAGLFDQSANFLKDYADSNVTEMDLGSLGKYTDKSHPSFQLASSLYMTNIENQLTSILSYLDFIYKTLPQKIESSLG